MKTDYTTIYPIDTLGFNKYFKSTPVETGSGFVFVNEIQDLYVVFLPETLEFGKLRAVGTSTKQKLEGLINTTDALLLCNLKGNSNDFVSHGNCLDPLPVIKKLYLAYKESVECWLYRNHLIYDLKTNKLIGSKSKSIRFYQSAGNRSEQITAAVGSVLVKVSQDQLHKAKKKYTKRFGNEVLGVILKVDVLDPFSTSLGRAGEVETLFSLPEYKKLLTSFGNGPEQLYIFLLTSINGNSDRSLNLVLETSAYDEISWRRIVFSGVESLHEEAGLVTVGLDKHSGISLSANTISSLDRQSLLIDQSEDVITVTFITPKTLVYLLRASLEGSCKEIVKSYLTSGSLFDAVLSLRTIAESNSMFLPNGSLIDATTRTYLKNAYS